MHPPSEVASVRHQSTKFYLGTFLKQINNRKYFSGKVFLIDSPGQPYEFNRNEK